jgi:hypothetical protein
MKNWTIALAALLVAALPALAQPQQDADKKVAGGGTLPAGWKGRLDNGDATLAGARVMAMGQGLHFQTGPAGIYYKPGDKPASGAYEVRATFSQLSAPAHPEAYGLIVGGANLDAPGQRYTYFLVRGDGKFLIKRRAGAETPTVVDWSDNAAIKKPDAAGKASNTLAVKVDGGKMHFLINGTEVSSADAAKVDAAGIAGLRINHNLNVMVDGFSVK